MRALEIGTGTGYNAACLAALGADVVTVEIDETIAGRARDSLRAAGFPGVTVLAGDGEPGAPDHAPFDRVLATAAARTVPYARVRQTRERGLLVVPCAGPGHRGGLFVLTVSQGTVTQGTGSQGTAAGKAEGDASFMPMRGTGSVSPSSAPSKPARTSR